MTVFDRVPVDDYEQVVFCHDRATGLKAIIAIHSTVLGPALGGTRFFPYPSEDAGLDDVLRLAKGMTYKAAAAGLDLGGGKAVIFGNPSVDKSEALLRVYARYVDSLGGRYITAEDVGTTQADMDTIRRETRFVTGVSQELGGSGDPSAATAYGVLWAMKAVAGRVWGQTSLARRHVAVSGVGKVGTSLVRHLVEERARVTVADVDVRAVERVVADYNVEACEPEKIHALDADIFSPCAMGAALDADTIPELRCTAVVGSANNQLATPDCDDLLHRLGVLYAPDFVVNAGGVINIASELSPRGYHPGGAYEQVRRIYDTITTVLDDAEAQGIPTGAAANHFAEGRIARLRHVHQIRTFGPRG